jgi:hypothetical protein
MNKPNHRPRKILKVKNTLCGIFVDLLQQAV